MKSRKNNLLNGGVVNPHYAIRKLTIGAASVLIGLAFAGINGHTVHADTSVKDVDQTSKNISDNKLTKVLNEQDPKQEVDSQQINNIHNYSQITSLKINNKRQNIQNLKSVLDEKREQPISTPKPNDANGDNTLNIDTGTTSASYKPSDRQNVKITLRLGGESGQDAPKNGDIYKINIPTGAYHIDEPTPISGELGSTTRQDNPDGSVTFIDKFTTSTPYTQTFILSPLTTDNLGDQRLSRFNFGDTLKEITVTKATSSDKVDRPLLKASFNQHLEATLQPTFKRILPQDPTKKLVVEQNYVYEVSVEQNDGLTNSNFKSFDPLITNSGEIIISAPSDFKLDKTATAAKNGNLSGLTITQENDQPGGKITIFYHPNLSSKVSQSDVLNAIQNGYYLVGKYDMSMPTKDVNEQFGINQTIVASQHLSDGKTTLSGKTGPWQDIIMGRKDSSGKDNPSALANALDAHVWCRNGMSEDKLAKNQYVKLNEFTLENLAPADLHKVHIDITIPDGFNCRNLLTDLSNFPDPSAVKYTVTYANATTSQPGGVELLTNTASAIRRIQIYVPELPIGYSTKTDDPDVQPDESNSGLLAMGNLADKYDNGTIVKSGDQFVTKLKVWSEEDGTNTVDDQTTQTLGTLDGLIQANVETEQNSHNPDDKNAGDIVWTINIKDEDLKNAIFYVVLPSNAKIGSNTNFIRNGFAWNSEGEHSTFTTQDGKTVFKVKYADGHFDYAFDTVTGEQLPEMYMRLFLDNGRPSQQDVHRDEQPYEIYAYLPEATNVQSSTGTIENLPQVKDDSGLQKDDELAYVEGHADAYKIGGGTWSLYHKLNYEASELAKGNQDANPVLAGTADATSSDKVMTYYASIINPTDTARTNYVFVTDLPTDGQNGSSFSFNMTEPAKVINPDTNHDLDGAQILYLDHYVDIKTGTPDISGATASPSDWSKVRAVIVKLATLPAQTAGRLIIKGEDPTLATDDGKIGNLVSYSKSDQVGPFRITERSGQSEQNLGAYSSIKVKAPKADNPPTTIKYSWTVKYQDEQGNTLQNSQVIGNEYKNGDHYNIMDQPQDTVYLQSIANNGKTYELEASKTENGNGTFSSANVTTTLIYKLKTVTPPATQKLKWTVQYKDEQGNALSDDKVIGANYKSGDPYDITNQSQGTVYLQSIVKDGKTYKLEASKTENGNGTFINADVITTLIYELKTSTPPTTQKLKWIVKYQDEDGHALNHEYIIGTNYKSGDPYDIVNQPKDTVYLQSIMKDGNTYELESNRTENGSGRFADNDVVTILIYKLQDEGGGTTPTTGSDPEPTPIPNSKTTTPTPTENQPSKPKKDQQKKITPGHRIIVEKKQNKQLPSQLNIVNRPQKQAELPQTGTNRNGRNERLGLIALVGGLLLGWIGADRTSRKRK